MAIAFVQANSFTTANRGRGDIKFIVIHDMEMAEKSTTAESCAAYFARSTTQASSHYTVDNDSVVQCVRDKDVAWCAPGANSTGLHFEHAGFAAQTRTDWLDPFGKAMLAVSARIVAAKCAQYGIPIRKGDYNDIRAGRPCIIGHWDVTKAYPDKGSHTDPGANFPWDYYIALVQAAAAGTPTTAGGFLMALTDQQQTDLYNRVMQAIPPATIKTRTNPDGSPVWLLTSADGDTLVKQILAAKVDPAALASSIVAALPAGGASVTDAQLEAALRKVLGSVDGATP